MNNESYLIPIHEGTTFVYMSVIIRLQNLPWSANALDIRQYFQGLSIPEGGVHIVGGELGDAFIAFSTDEDARQAMLTDGGKIKEVKIKLYLSSRSEMQKVIETARAQSITMQTFMQLPATQIPVVPPVPATQIPPTPSQTAPAMPMPQISQMPVKATPETKPPPPLPSVPAPSTDNPTLENIKSEPELEKKEQDTESLSSKETKRSRRGRSKSKSRDRSKSRSRSRDRNYRNKDRYRDRRRRERSRSRDRRDRRRYRDRSRSRERNARKSSRDRKRDSDQNDKNSSENNNSNHKIVPVLEKAVEKPTHPKPGFTNSGWVAAGSTEKSENPLTNPIGFSIGKPLSNSSTCNQAQLPKNQASSTLQIPLPQQSLPTSLQVPPSQPTSVSHPLLMPQPPPFPQLPLEVPKDENGHLRSLPFPPSQQSSSTISTQHNPMFVPNQPQLIQGEANKVIHQAQPGPLMMPPGWNPNMVNNPHLLLGHMPPPIGVNTAEKLSMPMMNVPMGMYVRPPALPPNNKLQQPHLQNDPRLSPGGFNMQQQRNDYRDNTASQFNNLNPQKQINYTEGTLSTNQRESFINACVEIRNMSMSTTVFDICRFFQGLQIPGDGIKIITDKKGNKIGMAYIRFAKQFFKDMALKKSGQLLKDTVVDVLHIDDNIFDRATDFTEPRNFFKDQNYQGQLDNFTGSNEPTESFTDLIIHEIPPFSRDRDIYNLFKGFNIEDAFVLCSTGRKTGTGYIKFRSPAEARRALAMSSRLSIGYTNVKATICYEDEFADARDRKNMEEDDEEIMDSKDNGHNFRENRNTRHSKKYPTYDYEPDEPDTRYNQNDKRPFNKTLLPTPNVKPFDQRSTQGNHGNISNNINSRFDRRQTDPRTPRDFHKKPYPHEDFHQKQYVKENSRFHMRSSLKDDFSEIRDSHGENKKPYPYDNVNKNVQEQSRKSQMQQPPSVSIESQHLPTTSKEHEIHLNTAAVHCDSAIGKEKETELSETNESGSETAIKDIVQNRDSSNKSDSMPLQIQLPNLKEEVNEQKEEGVNQEHGNNPQHTEIENQLNHATDCIILKGLPFNANDRDILDFFSDEGLAPTQIHIMLDKLGQPAGDAFCEFNTTEEVSRALTKNRTLMGRSVVAVEPVPRDEMMGALGVVVQLPFHELPERFPHLELRRPDLRFPQRGRGFPHFQPRGRGRGGFHVRHHVPTEVDLGTQNINMFGKPGCVLALENVPFRAEVDDILDFFRGYFITRENVIRRFDESGKPTGDARVCLNSPEDANRALRMLNQRQIYNRPIHLSLV